MKILITGGTGFLGKELGVALVRNGHQIVLVSRNAKRARLEAPFPCSVIEADLENSLLPDGSIIDVDAVVHLAGESVAGRRWTPHQKERILNSRVNGTRHLIQSIRSSSTKPKIWISASAIGYYGDRSEEELTESSSFGKGFLAEVTRAWEAESTAASELGMKTTLLRIGVVLGLDGGALSELIPLYRKGLGGPVGSGKQWMSWIHVQDVIGLIQHALEHPTENGLRIWNAVAPQPVQNRVFSRLLAQQLKAPHISHAPTLALSAILGEMSSLILGSQKVHPHAALDAGYKFKFSTLESAFDSLLQDLKNPIKPTQVCDVFQAKQWLPLPPDKLFPFFSEAKNLEKLTPEFLNFNILSTSTQRVQQDTEITYQLKLHGLPLRWLTRITHWNPPHQFVDLQLSGPYQLWHHTHRFESLAGGTLMHDVVQYQLPAGWLGRLTASSWVRSDIQKIFAYRRETVAQLFPVS